MRRSYVFSALALSLVTLGALGCDDKPAAPLAPAATALVTAKPAAANAVKLAVDPAASKVEFSMAAPAERIQGTVESASAGTSGELFVDPADVSKTTGLIAVDISKLVLHHAKKADGAADFGALEKNDMQNDHARAWLEISDDTPADIRKTNERVQFSIESIEGSSVTDVTKLTGADREVTLTAKGSFLLHGRKSPKTVELRAVFHYDGDKLTKVAIKTVKPFTVDLDEHDVRPREAFGKLAQKTLQMMSDKVAKEAQVDVDIVATLAK